MHILLGNALFTVWHINNVDPDSNICIVFNFSNCAVRSDDFNPTMFELQLLFLKTCFLQQAETQWNLCHYSHILYGGR